MKIREFIEKEVLLPGLKKRDVLVVYDPERRYRELCLQLANDKRRVVDASESSILSREEALLTLQEIGDRSGTIKEMLVYVPAKPPITDEQKQVDPFSIYGACGAVFPEGDGDEFLSLCLKAKPDSATELRRVFSDNPNPSFEVIDAIGGGAGWPVLQATLKVESARNILFALLAPSDLQKESLKNEEGWISEAKELLVRCLGLKLKTRGKSWSAIADELWRFVLYSEFVFDLPGDLPPSLKDVPSADEASRQLVNDLCEQLRNDKRTQALYIDKAEAVEEELNLRTACASLTNLGIRDTFLFEERFYFRRALQSFAKNDSEQVHILQQQQRGSVWSGKGESQAQWMLLERALDLVESCARVEHLLPENSKNLEALLGFYQSNAYEVDRLQREFEQEVNDQIRMGDDLDDVIAVTRNSYRKCASSLQEIFIRQVEISGWPPTGRLSITDVFDRKVAPKLERSGDRVAYLLIDALRFELGAVLGRLLNDDGQVDVEAAFSTLPSITAVGMAALLPGAGAGLRLSRADDELIVILGDKRLDNVSQRMDVLKKLYGQRFAEMPLSDFVRSKSSLSQEVDLLVVRSNSIDNQLESAPESALRSISYDTLKHIRAAVHKLRKMNFKEVIVATDHGFYLNAGAEAGDVCQKPQGNYFNAHERLLLGDITADAASFVVLADHVGIRSDFSQVAGPIAIASYRRGQLYFHGGVSLQETVVPVIAVSLRAEKAGSDSKVKVELRYRHGAKLITTRLPVVEVCVIGESLFDSNLEVLVEAQDKDGKVIGEAKPGGAVNPATHTISAEPGKSAFVTMKMYDDFEGKFTVKALNPTTLETYHSIDLETDYTV